MWGRARLVLALVCAVSAAARSAQTGVPGARFVTQHPWSGRGQWLNADTHVHTRFSDGGHTVAEVADHAVRAGCQAIAITDHASRQRGAATADYFQAIADARRAFPHLIIVGGVEWNIPPYNSREHATVLVPSPEREAEVLTEFKRRFDDFDRVDGTKPTAADGLRWLAGLAGGGAAAPVVLYNHPSRKDDDQAENVKDRLDWTAAGTVLRGFEGAPGHQGKPPIGSYEGKQETIDRWDPIVARAGDAWDALLQRGIDVHGAVASSDFHNANPASLNDFWPCAFSETWFDVPERSPAGLVRALAAGTFFGVHGHIARSVRLTVNAPGLTRPAAAGEVIELASPGPVTVTMTFDVPATDFDGKPNTIDAVEFFAITPAAVKVLDRPVGHTGAARVTQTMPVGPEGLVIRARGRRVRADGPDLMFYTNAIRVRVAR